MLYKSTNQKWTSLLHLAHVSYFTEDQIPRHTEYSQEIVSGWGHGQHGQGSSWRDFWNFLLFSSSRRSKSMAASSKAWINPFQDLRAGTWGATAALMPVPITSTSSRGFLVFRLGSSFLKGSNEWDNWEHPKTRGADQDHLKPRFSAPLLQKQRWQAQV